MYRRRQSGTSAADLEVLLAHPGGPFWTYKDAGAWTIPKGEYDDDEDPLDAAKREFEEETGCPAAAESKSVQYIDLGEIRQKGGKLVRAWAVEGDFDPANLCSNEFDLEFPAKSGKYITIPEVDRVEWFTPNDARAKIKDTQWPLVERLIASLK